jgi:anaphase-promoting complex subunit 1
MQAAEDALASRVDPEFEPRQPARESRRVSSLLSRADLNTSFDRSAFQDLASSGAGNSFSSQGRRGHSLGGAFERPSFGAGSMRRLRASTPGTFSRLSIDDVSETGTIVNNEMNGSQASTTFDDMEGLAELNGSQDGPDALDLQHPLDGLKKEFSMVKFKEIPMSSSPKSARATLERLKVPRFYSPQAS